MHSCAFLTKGEFMILRKGFLNLATLSLLGFLSVACNSGGSSTPTNDRYAEGIEEGKKQGYKTAYDAGYTAGYKDGDSAGYERARAYFASADYNKGFADGEAAGVSKGYTQGYAVGKTDGAKQGYTTGYNVGYDDGENDGYDQGYDDGADDGYDLGYADGMDDGYDIGFSKGRYGLSVGKAPRLQGYANLLSMVHDDLFDYSQISMPQQTRRGLVVDGRLLLSETSLTNKDTLKRAAAVEQHIVIEMAKQVKGKFGLSAERSLKVAKAANHFRKYATSRALTAEDTNAYATEIIGSNFSEITRAYEAGARGDLGEFQSVMERAAEKNETSPEKMALIVAKFFL